MKPKQGDGVAIAQESTLNMQMPQLLEQLFQRHHQRVLRAAYRITGNMADAEDVAQSVFMRLATSGGANIETAESYLYRAAINGSLDLIRMRQRGNEAPLDAAFEVVTSAPASSPDRQLSSSELRRWLRQAIAKLTPRAAEMFVLRYIEELDNREIARTLGTSQVLVAVTLHQARTKLKKQFERFIRGAR
jgi:RNA polymerase sigma-70 factor (ECF subfamily)